MLGQPSPARLFIRVRAVAAGRRTRAVCRDVARAGAFGSTARRTADLDRSRVPRPPPGCRRSMSRRRRRRRGSCRGWCRPSRSSSSRPSGDLLPRRGALEPALRRARRRRLDGGGVGIALSVPRMVDGRPRPDGNATASCSCASCWIWVGLAGPRQAFDLADRRGHRLYPLGMHALAALIAALTSVAMAPVSYTADGARLGFARGGSAALPAARAVRGSWSRQQRSRRCWCREFPVRAVVLGSRADGSRGGVRAGSRARPARRRRPALAARLPFRRGMLALHTTEVLVAVGTVLLAVLLGEQTPRRVALWCARSVLSLGAVVGGRSWQDCSPVVPPVRRSPRTAATPSSPAVGASAPRSPSRPGDGRARDPGSACLAGVGDGPSSSPA